MSEHLHKLLNSASFDATVFIQHDWTAAGIQSFILLKQQKDQSRSVSLEVFNNEYLRCFNWGIQFG